MSIPENATPPTPGAPAAERPTERTTERPSTAERARKVRYEDFKLADLTDNSDLNRIASPAPRDFERIEKYRRADFIPASRRRRAPGAHRRPRPERRDR